MIKRQIMYVPGSVGFWLSPVLAGDQQELLDDGSSDSCDLSWPELKAMFMGVNTMEGFEVACLVAQLTFHPASGCLSLASPSFHLSMDNVACDELYLISNGEVKRLYGINPLRVQLSYPEQESKVVDTVEFDCPPGVTEDQVKQTLHSAMKEKKRSEDEDRLTYMEDVLTLAALRLHATWSYLPIIECLEVW